MQQHKRRSLNTGVAEAVYRKKQIHDSTTLQRTAVLVLYYTQPLCVWLTNTYDQVYTGIARTMHPIQYGPICTHFGVTEVQSSHSMPLPHLNMHLSAHTHTHMHLPCTGILYTAHVHIQYVDSHKGVFLHNKRNLAQRVPCVNTPLLLLTCQCHSWRWTRIFDWLN